MMTLNDLTRAIDTAMICADEKPLTGWQKLAEENHPLACAWLIFVASVGIALRGVSENPWLVSYLF